MGTPRRLSSRATLQRMSADEQVRAARSSEQNGRPDTLRRNGSEWYESIESVGPEGGKEVFTAKKGRFPVGSERLRELRLMTMAVDRQRKTT